MTIGEALPNHALLPLPKAEDFGESPRRLYELLQELLAETCETVDEDEYADFMYSFHEAFEDRPVIHLSSLGDHVKERFRSQREIFELKF